MDSTPDLETGDVDSWTADRGGITYRVDLWDDCEANSQSVADIAADDEGLSPSDLAAFVRDDWRYVGVVVVPLVDDLPVIQARVSLWHCGWGTMPAETEPWQGGMHAELNMDRAAIEDQAADLFGEARAELVRFRALLSALPLD